MKRAYVVYDKDNCDTRAAIIAETGTKAKSIAYGNFSDFLGGDWIDLRVKWIRGANVDGLHIGDCVDQDEAYIRKIVDYIVG